MRNLLLFLAKSRKKFLLFLLIIIVTVFYLRLSFVTVFVPVVFVSIM